ncbi:MAG: hypothetical protein KJ070_19145 [Verrucomicrobia bacterium]|nr:hypothetical protein [Verrucomicrobiota bacterium]
MNTCARFMAAGWVAGVFLLTAQAAEWSGEFPLPKVVTNSVCAGGVPNNMTALSSGRTYIVFKETTNGISRFKFTWTDDHGTNWATPLPFNPQPGAPPSGLPSLIADTADRLHCSWLTTPTRVCRSRRTRITSRSPTPPTPASTGRTPVARTALPAFHPPAKTTPCAKPPTTTRTTSSGISGRNAWAAPKTLWARASFVAAKC